MRCYLVQVNSTYTRVLLEIFLALASITNALYIDWIFNSNI
jgi:hypothetical protein